MPLTAIDSGPLVVAVQAVLHVVRAADFMEYVFACVSRERDFRILYCVSSKVAHPRLVKVEAG